MRSLILMIVLSLLSTMAWANPVQDTVGAGNCCDANGQATNCSDRATQPPRGGPGEETEDENATQTVES